MKRYKWTIFFCLLTPLLLLPVVYLMGGGHGYYSPAFVLFPLGMIGTVFQDSITPPFIIFGFLQFPVYGYLLDRAKNHKTKYLLPVVHIICVIIIFWATNFK